MPPSDSLARALEPFGDAASPAARVTPIAEPTILTKSLAMQTAMKMAEVVARHKTPVLVEGESGTGKELLARYVHTHSDRAQGPFVAVNCGAIPETLLESELFGYEKGAFTGALSFKAGKFELAAGGTILLDDVSELAPALQVKLLRVLQEYEIDRLGGRGALKVDTRVVCTSNRSLKKLVAEGKFREDLFYRINVFPLKLAPLRERLEDLDVLVPHFMAKYNGEVVKEVDREAYQKLAAYAWRGNVRELENVVARAILLSYDSPRLSERHIVFDDLDAATPAEEPPMGEMTLREMEKRLILRTLRRCNGNRTHAAAALQISVRTMRNKLAEYRANGELTEAAGAGG
ncbi:MAG: sigma-54-dependent Fis family transcriptional regulator [Myxococcales bacterium]|nr:MAG: sigma-54-dependent Fis family transcriptional regulator [Myxococcales bacterium]